MAKVADPRLYDIANDKHLLFDARTIVCAWSTLNPAVHIQLHRLHVTIGDVCLCEGAKHVRDGLVVGTHRFSNGCGSMLDTQLHDGDVRCHLNDALSMYLQVSALQHVIVCTDADGEQTEKTCQ
jgi:hypothetical protein